jgi:zinc/manganese transport system substrate-binding protein
MVNFLMVLRPLLGALCLSMVLAPTAPAAPAAPLQVVASFSILGDMVQEIAGDEAVVSSLVGPNADAHAYEPSPAAVKRLASANLVIINGLRFEGWMDRMVRLSGYKGPIVVATHGITPRTVNGAADPHAWHSPAHARSYIQNIAQALSQAAPSRTAIFEQRARDYLLRLDAIDQQTRSRLATLTPEQRKIITAHDAFGYLGQAYQITLLAPQGWNASTQASAGQVGRIIRQIKAQKVSAIFVENISDPRLIQRIAAESGALVGGTLYSDALSLPGGPADTYLKLMSHNLTSIENVLNRARQ